jgi:hypothetical protein
MANGLPKQARRVLHAAIRASWVFVGDGQKALFLINEGDAMVPNLRCLSSEEHQDPPSREQGSDAPGRAFSSVGEIRSASAIGAARHRATSAPEVVSVACVYPLLTTMGLCVWVTEHVPPKFWTFATRKCVALFFRRSPLRPRRLPGLRGVHFCTDRRLLACYLCSETKGKSNRAKP